MTFEPATPASMGPITIHRDVLPDIIGFLPAAAAARLQALRDRCSDLHLLIPEFEERRTAGEARLAAEQRLKRLTDHPQHGGFGLEPGRPAHQGRTARPRQADRRRKADHRPLRNAGSGGRQAGAVCRAWKAGLAMVADRQAPCCKISADPSRSCSRVRASPTPSTGCAIVSVTYARPSSH